MRSSIFLHISHTDVRNDSRILKEMVAVSGMSDATVVGIGMEDHEGSPSSSAQDRVVLHAIRPIFRRFKWLPKLVYYAFVFVELTLRLVVQGVKLKPSVVHCHDTLVLPAGVLIKLLSRARLVYDAHELESDKNGQTRALSSVTLLIEKGCWRWIDGFISVSDSIVEWYLRRFTYKLNAVVLNSPVFSSQEDHKATGGSEHFRATFGIPHGELIFLYVGILAKGRGIETLLEVFSDPSVSAHLIFMGYGDLGTSISDTASNHPNIHLHGPVPHQLVVEYASGADVGLCFVENVSLSDYYCLPNKLFEYSFAGIPVLASDFPEIRRVVGSFSLGKVCQPDRDAVRAAVLSFIGSSPARISSDLSELSWGRQAERLVSLYEDLVGKRGLSA